MGCDLSHVNTITEFGELMCDNASNLSYVNLVSGTVGTKAFKDLVLNVPLSSTFSLDMTGVPTTCVISTPVEHRAEHHPRQVTPHYQDIENKRRRRCHKILYFPDFG